MRWKRTTDSITCISRFPPAIASFLRTLPSSLNEKAPSRHITVEAEAARGALCVSRKSFPHGGLPGKQADMEIVERNTDRATVLELSGEIDLSAAPGFRAELSKRAEARTPVLLLDFSGVDYIDSSGLAALIEYVRSASAHGGRMALFGLQPKVKMVFDLVKLDQLFPIRADEDTALKACAVD